MDIFAGASFVVMQSLTFCLEHNDQVSILDMDGHSLGTLDVVLSPTDQRGQPLPESLTCVEDPDELMGTPFSFKVSSNIVECADVKAKRNNLKFDRV